MFIQPGFELLYRQGFVIVEALGEITAALAQDVDLADGFHAFGYADEADFLGHADHVAEHDVLPFSLGVFIDGQEVLVHLQDIPGDLPDQVQGTVADSKIVHGGVDAGLLQGAGDAGIPRP